MKAIKCELCGSNQLFKKDGFFQCEYCGTKYSLEEARKLLGKVEIEGDVSVKGADFIIRAGVLEKYNGSDVNVVIPSNVTVIGEEAFSNCSGLISVEIPNLVFKINDAKKRDQGAFYECISLRRIKLPNNMQEIGINAFFGCKNLEQIFIPNSIKVIGASAFQNCSKLTSITLPYRIETIPDYAFQNCKSLTSITIPNSVTHIGYNAFGNCSNLTSITIPNSVTSIEYSSFDGCEKLLNVSISEQMESNISCTPYYQRKQRRKEGTCQYCGSTFKGVFTKICSQCGKPKDY